MPASNRLNALQVAKLKEPGRYGDGGGLYLRVAEYETKAGLARSKNWVFRYERGGRERLMGLGSMDTLSLADARVKARECRKSLLDGIDPIDARAAITAAIKTHAARQIKFKQYAETFIEEHRSSWKNPVHARQWSSTLELYVYPIIGSIWVSKIDTALVLKCLQPIWRRIPDTARRVRGRIEQILDGAKAHGYRDGENPARLTGHLDKLLVQTRKSQRVKHHPALPYEDIPAFMAELRSKPEVSARALEFLILTAARTTETILTSRAEIDLKNNLWTVPGERMKSGREHVVPLSGRAVEIVKSLPHETRGGFLFIGAREKQPLSNMAMLELLRGMRPGFTVHGFRSSFRDWAGDRTNHSRDVVEAALAHVIKNETEAAYRRRTAIEKRKRLMADWARYCQSEAVGGNVTPIHGRSR